MNLALQRLLPTKDPRWRTVHQFVYDDAIDVLEGATRMGRVGKPLLWRVVIDDELQQALLYWTRSSGWVFVIQGNAHGDDSKKEDSAKED